MTDLTPTPRPRRPRPAVVTLTPAAADRVRDLLAAQPDKAGLKIGLKNGGCAGQEYTFAMAEAAEPMDEVVSADGATVIVDGKAVLYLLGSEIDYETTRVASRFVFRNPNQTDACGCGESVTITPAERSPS
jgi:iron-sulfur cluster assembly protein